MHTLIKQIASKAKSHFGNAASCDSCSLSCSLPFNYNPIPLSRSSSQSLDSSENSDLFFIDGGNGVLLSHASFHLEFQKIALSYYHDQKRLFLLEIPFYALFETQSNSYSASFEFEECKLHSSRFQLDSFPDLNEKLNQFFLGIDAADLLDKAAIVSNALPELANELRRILEFELAFFLNNEYFSSSDFIPSHYGFVFDGSLFEYQMFISEYHSVMKEGSLSFVGIAKSNTLLSKEGISMNSFIASNYPVLGTWTSPSLFDVEYYSLRLTHFHEKAKLFFRVDIISSLDHVSLLESLVPFSNDPIFLGYPYPLIEIDQFARVSFEEVNLLKQQISFAFEKEGISMDLFADAHEILDRIKF